LLVRYGVLMAVFRAQKTCHFLKYFCGNWAKRQKQIPFGDDKQEKQGQELLSKES
jgi:hypothetical protein